MSTVNDSDGDHRQKEDWLGVDGSDDEEFARDAHSEDERETSRVKGIPRHTSKRRKVQHNSSNSEDDEDDEDSDASDKEYVGDTTKKRRKNAEEEVEFEGEDDLLITNPNKLKPLSKEELVASKAKTEKTGVVYLSRIPPFMKPMKVKQLLSCFGEIGRIFLAPEDPKAYARRVRFGGNKKRNFEEGWVEFMNKKDAKLVAETLNASIIGGKKGSYYYDDVWNIKYLPKFKWHHLQAQIAYENASRQAKMRAEISQATRENKTYIRNVERAKMVENMESNGRKRKKEKGGEEGGKGGEEVAKVEVRRQFRQHKAKGRAVEEGSERKEASENFKRLLSKVF
ncbi:RNA-binding ATPase activator esf2 [Rhizina undulata]